MSNSHLHIARSSKKDEFYTRLPDIEKELAHYKDQFRDKVVYCNCDDYRQSSFWDYFSSNFGRLGLKKLIATGYRKNGHGVGAMSNGHNTVSFSLDGDGDFRSLECIQYLEQSDIVVTNPPFSLFRSYISQLLEHKKKFLVVGNMNAIAYQEIFPLIKSNMLWLGCHNGEMAFKIPECYEERKTRFWVDASGQKWRSLGNACWFTNIIHNRRTTPLSLSKTYNPVEYPRYDNYDAINVSRAVDIPVDYDGTMGVPISFLDKYCPEQFEIVGLAKRGGEPELKTRIYMKNEYSNYSDLNAGPTLLDENGIPRVVYARILIHRK